MKKQIYLAGGFFFDKQNDLVTRAHTALKHNPTVGYIHSPREHQYQNVTAENDPEGIFGSYEWATETYNNDLTAMGLADLAVVVWDNVQPDMGTAWEMGYLAALHKPIVLTCEDSVEQVGINLMLIKGSKTFLTQVQELKDFDFNLIPTKLYKGLII